MVLFTLAATALASAGSPHHARPAAAGIIAPHTETNVAHAASGHDHKQGNVWAPTVGKCLRPAAAATECTLSPRLALAGAAPDTAAFPTTTAPGQRLISLSVLRVWGPDSPDSSLPALHSASTRAAWPTEVPFRPNQPVRL
jgi:hypothetical protein